MSLDRHQKTPTYQLATSQRLRGVSDGYLQVPAAISGLHPLNTLEGRPGRERVKEQNSLKVTTRGYLH